MLIINSPQGKLHQFFDEIIDIPNCERKTKAYIVNIFSDINIKNDFSKNSITLLYNDAIQNYNFERFQTIGDWLLLTKCMFPESLNGASAEFYDAIAKNSYYRCYVILNRKWLIFEELADSFSTYTQNIKLSLSNSAKNSAKRFRLF